MLQIWFGDREDANYGPSWFQHNYHPEWFEDPFVQEMVLAVDQSEVRSALVIDSPVLGPIPPEKLSGGLQTLIMIYEKPSLIFDATSCGENCAEWLLKIGNQKNVTVCLNYAMPFRAAEPFDLMILNENRVVHTFRDYVSVAIRYV